MSMQANQENTSRTMTIWAGFKNFLMRGDLVVAAVALSVALALSTVISSLSSDLIKPLLARAQGPRPIALGIQLGHNTNTFMNFGAFISALIYFVIYMAILYFAIVVPYKTIQARRGVTVFGNPAPAKSCPYCLSDDLPVAASKCRYCGSELPMSR